MRRTIEIHTSYRNAVVYPEPSEPRRSPARKNTKRWCRGKVGLKHQPEWKSDVHLPAFRILACTICGRHLDYCAGFQTECRCGQHEVRRGA
jgi:hypothetical protein